MKCHEIVEKLSAYMDDELDAVLSRRITNHLDHCSQCRSELEELSGVDALVRELPQYSVPVDVTGKILAEVQRTGSAEDRSSRLHRTWAWLAARFQGFFDLMEPATVPSTHVLEEFNDVPVSFIGHIYFKII